jgi:hypothetical protein
MDQFGLMRLSYLPSSKLQYVTGTDSSPPHFLRSNSTKGRCLSRGLRTQQAPRLINV